MQLFFYNENPVRKSGNFSASGDADFFCKKIKKQGFIFGGYRNYISVRVNNPKQSGRANPARGRIVGPAYVAGRAVSPAGKRKRNRNRRYATGCEPFPK